MDMLSDMRGWNLFTFWTYVVFGAVAALSVIVAIIAMVAGALPLGLLLLVVAAVLGIMSASVKRSYDSVTRPE